MTRLEIKKAVEEASEDEPFTMPFFLAGLMVEEMRRQNIPRIIYEDPDFNVTAWIRPRRELADQRRERRNEL